MKDVNFVQQHILPNDICSLNERSPYDRLVLKKFKYRNLYSKMVARLQLSVVSFYQIGQFHNWVQLAVILREGRVGPLLLEFGDKGRMTESPEPSFPSRFSRK